MILIFFYVTSRNYLIDTAKKTVISPNFLTWKFCGKEQFPHSFRRYSIYLRILETSFIIKSVKVLIVRHCNAILIPTRSSNVLPISQRIN